MKEKNKKVWTISTLQASPSMNCDFQDFTGTFAEAMEFTETEWRKHGRSMCVRSENDRAGHWWFRIDAAGVATNRNQVPTVTKQLTRTAVAPGNGRVKLIGIGSYCVTSLETIEIGKKIKAWIAAREAEGWIVDFRIRESGGQIGVMWQCVAGDRGPSAPEFTPCIGMDGQEFSMN